MNLFLNHQVDSASAMTYNELAQVLESKNPKTGKLYTLKDLNVIKMQNVGTGMLEDGLFVRLVPGSRARRTRTTAVEVHRRLARRLDLLPRPRRPSASSSRSRPARRLPKGHQTWMMNEINKLIWPNPAAASGS